MPRGQRASLPVAGEQYGVVVSDKVFLSLRTKEAKIARERFPLAINALNAFFESLGQPPQTLGRADVRALAGETYKQAVSDIDHDDAVADEVEAYRDAFAEATAHHLNEGTSEKIAELEAVIEMPGERVICIVLAQGDTIHPTDVAELERWLTSGIAREHDRVGLQHHDGPEHGQHVGPAMAGHRTGIWRRGNEKLGTLYSTEAFTDNRRSAAE